MKQKFLDLAGLTAYDKKIKAWFNAGTVDITDDAINALFAAPISYEAVDLGLPGGLKWADRLVGASVPGEPGLYFQWGDIVGYTKEQVETGEKVFDASTHKYCDRRYYMLTKYCNNLEYGKDGFTDGKITLDLEDDAAYIHMGSDWRMPTKEEFQNLISYTTPTFIDLQGNEFSQTEVRSGSISEGNLKGIKLTGPNGNSIFIPACGFCFNSSCYGISHYGKLWSSSLVKDIPYNSDALDFDCNSSYSIGGDSYGRAEGLCVLGVKA